MVFSAKFALEVALPLAEAAYVPAKLPAGWEVISPIQPGDFGIVAVQDKTVVVAFRGIQHEKEWLADLDAEIVKFPYGNGMVHKGFLGVYESIRPSVLQTLSKLAVSHEFEELLFIGHSLGAALATLCAADCF